MNFNPHQSTITGPSVEEGSLGSDPREVAPLRGAADDFVPLSLVRLAKLQQEVISVVVFLIQSVSL